MFGGAMEESFREFSATEASAEHDSNPGSVLLTQVNPGILNSQ
jgi:hypothetical protein